MYLTGAMEAYNRFVGCRAEIIYRKFNGGEGIIYETPQGALVENMPNQVVGPLVGRIGTIVDYEDDAYNTDRPHGYERSYVTFKLDDGREIVVDRAFVQILNPNEAIFA